MKIDDNLEFYQWASKKYIHYHKHEYSETSEQLVVN